MSDSGPYKIIIYHGGAEGICRFKNREQFEEARRFLKRLTGMSDRVRGGLSDDSVYDFYCVDNDEYEAFARFMKKIDAL